MSIPPDALPLSLSHGAVVAQSEGIIMDELPSTVFASEEPAAQAHGALVLGFRSRLGPSSLIDLRMGQLRAQRMLICARCKLWWMTPEWRSSTLELPPETQFLLVEVRGHTGAPPQTQSTYALLLPLIDGPFRGTLRADSAKDAREGGLVLRMESGDKRVTQDTWSKALYIAAGSDPFQLIQRGVAVAAGLSGGALPLSQKQLPRSLDAFGWCTWDAFYSSVSARSVLQGLASLRKGGIRARTLIIDDGWQSTDVDPDFRKPVGPAAMAAAQAAEAQQRAAQGLFLRILHTIQRWLLSLGTTLFLLWYQNVVEPAPPGSWPVRLFTWLAAGPMRHALLTFFADASDFTRRLTSVKANSKFSGPDAGPEDAGAEAGAGDTGLANVVATIKSRFGVEFVLCWHGLPAYWSGVMSGAPEMQQYHPTLMYAEATPGVLEVEPSMAWNPAVLAGVGVIDDPGKLYNHMHEYLRSSGVDGVKVDCQAGLGLVGNALGGGAALSRRFHGALEQSVSSNFPGNHCINCMCHSTENLYCMTQTSVARASDDFFPRDPASSHPHIAACTFNGLFMAVLVQPDWDMFHSKHSSGQMHGMARAISGGAVYVSDKPGEHDFDLLRRLVLPDGSVLRATQAARPTRDSLFHDVLRDDKSLLKIWNVNTWCGVIGVFHLQGSSWDRCRRKFIVHDKSPRALTTQVSPQDIEHSLPGHQQQQQDGSALFAVYSFVGQELAVVGRDAAVAVSLQAAGSELITVSPVMEVSGVRFAPLGLSQMYNGGGAVLSCTSVPSGSLVVSFSVDVQGCGGFLVYCSQAPVGVSVGNLALFHTYDPVLGALRLDIPATQDLRCTVRFSF